MFDDFFTNPPSLKICGVTSLDDAKGLVELGVDALGINFWPPSKRYCSPDLARTFSSEIKGKILRVGVFVNNSRPLADELFDEELIDVVQLHGDENLHDIEHFLDRGIPVIRAVSANHLPDNPLPEKNFALLIDTPAGKDYGGTGKTFDWSIARDFIAENPTVPVILAGGLTPENSAKALSSVNPAALDIASGAELSPGVKNFDKINLLLHTIRK